MSFALRLLDILPVLVSTSQKEHIVTEQSLVRTIASPTTFVYACPRCGRR